jgi:hypothetical protein
MKKSLLFISMIVMLAAVAAFAFTSPALAYSWVPADEECAIEGGVWVQTGENTGYCEFSPDHTYSQMDCPSGYGYFAFVEIDETGWWWVTNAACKTGYSTTSQTNTDVTSGKPVDAWNGNCGAYISNPPVSGSVTISKVTMPSGPNLQTICKMNYYDFEGTSLANFGSPGWVYYNLNADTANLWNDGKLTMYVYQNDAWQACRNPLFVDAGEYGRVACYAENPLYFGIGTAINGTNSTTSPSWKTQ